MQTIPQTGIGKPSIFSAMAEQPKERAVATAKTHCWYCNKPLNGNRRFCGKECEEAIYEDNDKARKRRLIFGCHC